MDGIHIMILAVIISVVSSFSVDSLKYQTLVPTLLPTRYTELEALSWDSTQSESEPQYNSNSLSLSLKLHHIDNLIMSSHHQGGKMTWESLFKKRLERDALRANMLFAITKSRTSASEYFSSPLISGLKWGNGNYFTRIAVGSPPKYFYMIMDTGSQIIWLQCQPCTKCYEEVGPIFDPNTSTSFRRGVPCKSKICGNGNSGHCLHNLKRCAYNISYGDGSFSLGKVVTETLTFTKTEVPNVILGCGHDNEGLFFASAGLLGLARDKQLSFVAQAGNNFGNKFSYCLANRWPWPSSNKSNNSSSSSYLIFGDSPACGKAAVYTPLVNNPIREELNMLYYVELEGFSVGGSLVPGINASMFDFDRKTGDGGVIVDSGTTVTRLPKSTYKALRDAFRKATKHLKPASKFQFLDTCYDLSGKKEMKVPTVDLHFGGGAIVYLPQSNYMIPVDDNKMTYCFAFAGTESDGGVSIIGNIQQQGFGMVYDLPNNRLGFVPNAC